jgi:pSer/pThr/pTyr-binding forkhead associated (FHA) protein
VATERIGRSSQSRGIHPEIAIDSDTAVSRQHAQLVAINRAGVADAAADAYAAVDLGSTNGTYLNGIKLTRARKLTPGDVLRVGETELRYEA